MNFLDRIYQGNIPRQQTKTNNTGWLLKDYNMSYSRFKKATEHDEIPVEPLRVVDDKLQVY